MTMNFGFSEVENLLETGSSPGSLGENSGLLEEDLDDKTLFMMEPEADVQSDSTPMGDFQELGEASTLSGVEAPNDELVDEEIGEQTFPGVDTMEGLESQQEDIDFLDEFDEFDDLGSLPEFDLSEGSTEFTEPSVGSEVPFSEPSTRGGSGFSLVEEEDQSIIGDDDISVTTALKTKMAYCPIGLSRCDHKG